MWHEDDEDEQLIVIERGGVSASAFFWGIAIGAGVALLMAPRSGAETRADIQRRARRVQSAARDQVEQITDTVTDSYQQARTAVEDRIDSARQAIELKKRQATRAIEAGREAAQHARDDLERRIEETKAAYEAGADVARRRRTGTPASPLDEEIGPV